jgi:hypothetical protein
VEGRRLYRTERERADSTPDRPRLAGPLTPVLDGLLRLDPEARMTPAEAEDRLRRLAGVSPVPVVKVAERAARNHVVHPAGGRLRRRTAAAAILAAGLMLAVLTAATGRLAWSDDGVRVRAVSASSTSPPDVFVLPSGFAWWNDQSGFSAAVPSRWPSRRDAHGAVVLTAPGGQPTLRIGSWRSGPPDVVAALVERERAAVLPAYKRIRIEALSRSGDAVWEYTYRDPVSGPVRGLQQVMTFDGRAYLIEWRVPRAAWVANLPKLAVVLESFRPLRSA